MQTRVENLLDIEDNKRRKLKSAYENYEEDVGELRKYMYVQGMFEQINGTERSEFRNMN